VPTGAEEIRRSASSTTRRRRSARCASAPKGLLRDRPGVGRSSSRSSTCRRATARSSVPGARSTSKQTSLADQDLAHLPAQTTDGPAVLGAVGAPGELDPKPTIPSAPGSKPPLLPFAADAHRGLAGKIGGRIRVRWGSRRQSLPRMPRCSRRNRTLRRWPPCSRRSTAGRKLPNPKTARRPRVGKA
jgi:hypothetical protein